MQMQFIRICRFSSLFPSSAKGRETHSGYAHNLRSDCRIALNA